MSPVEAECKKLEAWDAMQKVRQAGGCLLRIHEGRGWRMRLYNGRGVPHYLKQQLVELQPYVMILLREICYDVN
jgi:hypothetical protein